MKPMLAATLESLDDVQFPVYVQPKLDGIRCLIHNGQAVSRNLKPIPNKYIQERLKGLPDGLDGELIVVDNTKRGMPFVDFNTSQSAIMSEEGEPDFLYIIFDYISDKNYTGRWFSQKLCPQAKDKPAIAIETQLATSIDWVNKLERDYTQMGYEGIILRSIDSPYKFGRSTVKEGYLLKYKRFKDAEAQVIGFEELLRNENKPVQDALGHAKRSSHKANMVPANTLGSLIVYDERLNIEFNVGSGFTLEQRNEIWNNQKKYMGQMITYTYQELSKKNTPRFPTFKGFRYDI